jgi:hypothetical protein
MSDPAEEVQTRSYPTEEVPPPSNRTPVQVKGPGISRFALPAALLLAVVATVLSIWSLVSASSKSSDTALPGDPKLRVCTAFGTVSKAVPLQTNNNLGNEPVAQAAVAGNARLSLLGGGQYLLSQLDSKTPQQLADPVRSFGYDLQDIGMNALAGVPNSDPALAAKLAEADATRKQIADLCK